MFDALVLCTCSSCLSDRTECLQDGAMWQVNLRGSKPGIAELYEGHDGADDADTVIILDISSHYPRNTCRMH